MSTEDITTFLLIVLTVAGGVGFGHWMGDWGAGVLAWAVLTIALRFVNK